MLRPCCRVLSCLARPHLRPRRVLTLNCASNVPSRRFCAGDNPFKQAAKREDSLDEGKKVEKEGGQEVPEDEVARDDDRTETEEIQSLLNKTFIAKNDQYEGGSDEEEGGHDHEEDGEDDATLTIPFPNDMTASWEAHRVLDVGLFRRMAAKAQVALIRSKIDASFDPEEFVKGAGFAYRGVVAAAMEPGGKRLQEMSVDETLFSRKVSKGLLQLVEEGQWLGWGDLEGGKVLVHNLHCEIVAASLVWPEDHSFGDDFRQVESALFDVRFLTYESLQLNEGDEPQPKMLARTWRFEGQLLAGGDGDGERHTNEDLQFAIVKIEGLETPEEDDHSRE